MPPLNGCSNDSTITYPPLGTCVSPGGVQTCEYTPTFTDCTQTGQVCKSGGCANPDILLFSEVRSRGSGGDIDEIIELYNPTAFPITFNNTWSITTRSAAGCNFQTTTKLNGQGQVIPSHGHLLLVGGTYDDPVLWDYGYGSGFVDSGQLTLVHAGAPIDTLCTWFNNATLQNLTNPACSFSCEGTPVSNLPHNDSSSASSNVDVSLERKPGGAAGNGQDTGNSANDWMGNVPSNPQNLASPATP